MALILVAGPIREVSPLAAAWTVPCILFAALLIAWAAESAQFFIAQGFALAILAWMQTLPEFAVEAVLAWKQQVPFLLANLTGALRLLTGMGWPLIYLAAAVAHRKSSGQPLRRIPLEGEHSVQVVATLPPLLYAAFTWWKGTLNLFDAAVLIALYAAYLLLLGRMPPQEEEGIEDLERIPRAIVTAPRPWRIGLITACFVGGGVLIYFTAEPFLASLLAIAVRVGVPSFLFIQWVAPFVSEFPELASTFYWARTVHRAPMALMNMLSSNINQWTLLVAMLPILYSAGHGGPASIPFDERQRLELLMTIGQALVGLLFLINMELAWWEALALFVLWIVQVVFSALEAGPSVQYFITGAYFAWAAVELVRILLGRRTVQALPEFAKLFRQHVTRQQTASR